MTHSTVYLSKRGQAVRLTKSVALTDDVQQVEIVRLGHSHLISPIGRRWDDLFRNGPRVSGDFMRERRQPVMEQREPF